MPESSDKSRSHKEKDQQLPKQDQQPEPADPVSVTGITDASEPRYNGEIDASAGKTENTEEFPSWLLELESKVNAPIETVHKKAT
jgi:hypothetical protein